MLKRWTKNVSQFVGPCFDMALEHDDHCIPSSFSCLLAMETKAKQLKLIRFRDFTVDLVATQGSTTPR